ncbi:Chorismate binding-like protein [Xylanimonas cellulosilytica DSM 15894]|uniref:Chorismate binding-like protein n=1 Tax=Xylanimonas cellulosilytica (strain DSM 15894 / JCM 12276 / CECT 5975 / KCTC 9989 / LMG 20990 / NBRC 107835 / XIL07) TaxID=446471 RepID=D1BT54_XYLCX|nr:anthranilate synthase component I family protein [Xylanimonas cellulosilytica]ACZ30896.1 Chorismate binding-like protein [Xylanimonas cellulosilytica DSM 15894]
MPSSPSWARFAGRLATGVVECVDLARDPQRLRTGLWFVVVDFEADLGGGTTGRPGRARAWRFAQVRDVTPDDDAPRADAVGPGWRGPPSDAWTSSMGRAEYEAAVARVREHVRDGDVYQANVCRVLSAPLPAGVAGAGSPEPDAAALARVLGAGNPAPYAAAIHVPAGGDVEPVWVVSASPELYLRLQDGTVESGPIKGTARTPDGLSDKDYAENVMITDLVRNDLQHVCRPGTVEVTDLCAVEAHPGLVHLVSRVRGVLSAPDAPDLWAHLLAGTFPPGSVSGAPKSSALRIIRALEPVPRGPYCGAVGWVDGDAGTAELAVGIRTFWWEHGMLRFGTGAGITWGSDPAAEWHETELKAARLVGLASGPGTARVRSDDSTSPSSSDRT